MSAAPAPANGSSSSSSSDALFAQLLHRAAERFPTEGSVLATPQPPTLADFIEATFPFKLDAWQKLLCARLQRFRTEGGQRLLIHAPPQTGKSVLLSQRFPAWLLGCDPTRRIKLACYNVTHAVRFSKILVQIMQDKEFARFFPNPACRLVSDNQEEWSTFARTAFRDGQPSFKALGLRTGFVGQGATDLFIDDPYSSPQEAMSAIMRESVWAFWSAGAKVRIREDSNVAVMFHRYHDEDIAGRLMREEGLKSEGGVWEMLRFAAIADDDERSPDPLGRAVGEKLTHRLSDAFLAEQQKTPSVWLGQFQGRPLPPGGALIKRHYFRTLTPEQLPPLKQAVFGCDLAVSKRTTADYTVAFPLGVDEQNRYYLFRPARGQWEPPEARREIITRLQSFRSVYAVRRVGMESVAALSGYVSEMRREKDMAGYAVMDIGRHGQDKVLLASGWIPIAEQGRICLVDDGTGWHETFLQECESFPLGAHDDQVDALGIAFLTLTAKTDAIPMGNTFGKASGGWNRAR